MYVESAYGPHSTELARCVYANRLTALLSQHTSTQSMLKQQRAQGRLSALFASRIEERRLEREKEVLLLREHEETDEALHEEYDSVMRFNDANPAGRQARRTYLECLLRWNYIRVIDARQGKWSWRPGVRQLSTRRRFSPMHRWQQQASCRWSHSAQHARGRCIVSHSVTHACTDQLALVQFSARSRPQHELDQHSLARKHETSSELLRLLQCDT